MLQPRLLFTCHGTKTVTAFTSRLLLRTEWASYWTVRELLEDYLYSLCANRTENSDALLVRSTAQKTSHVAVTVAWRLTAAEMCLPVWCVATSEVACVTQKQAINARTSIVACVFRGFCGLTVLALGKYTTLFRCRPLQLYQLMCISDAIQKFVISSYPVCTFLFHWFLCWSHT
jgi:hypothetical protein